MASLEERIGLRQEPQPPHHPDKKARLRRRLRFSALGATGIVLGALFGAPILDELNEPSDTTQQQPVTANTAKPTPEQTSEAPKPTPNPELDNIEILPFDKTLSETEKLERFVNHYELLAEEVATEFSVPKDLLLAMGAKESALDAPGTSELAIKTNSLFMISTTNENQPYYTAPTKIQVSDPDAHDNRTIDTPRTPLGDGTFEITVDNPYQKFNNVRESFWHQGQAINDRLESDTCSEDSPTDCLSKLYEDGSTPYSLEVSKIINNIDQLVATPEVTEAKPEEEEETKKPIYILGDSIMDGAREAVTTRLTNQGYPKVVINAATSRTIGKAGNSSQTGLQATKADKAKIKDAGTVVVGLASNGGTYKKSIEVMVKNIKAINPNVKIYWVNIAATSGSAELIEDSTNTAIDFAVKKGWIDGAIDWYGIANSNPRLIDAGPNGYGVHPTSEGYEKLAELITESVLGAGEK